MIRYLLVVTRPVLVQCMTKNAVACLYYFAFRDALAEGVGEAATPSAFLHGGRRSKKFPSY